MGSVKSILQDDLEICYCRDFSCEGRLEIHHIFYGHGKRKISDREGLIVALCRNHHTGTIGVHGRDGRKLGEMLMREAQEKWEENYIENYPYENHAEQCAREAFREMMGESYL